MTRTPLKRFPLLRRKLGSVMSNYVQGTYNQALPVFFFCSCSDFPDSCSTPNKQKRKGSVLGLDPQDLNLKSPSKRACKKHSPLPAPAKQVKRCGKNSSEPHFFCSPFTCPFFCMFGLLVHAQPWTWNGASYSFRYSIKAMDGWNHTCWFGVANWEVFQVFFGVEQREPFFWWTSIYAFTKYPALQDFTCWYGWELLL